jgi:hypothetical protein
MLLCHPLMMLKKGLQLKYIVLLNFQNTNTYLSLLGAYMATGQLLGGGGGVIQNFRGGGVWQKSSTPFLMHNIFPKKKMWPCMAGCP